MRLFRSSARPVRVAPVFRARLSAEVLEVRDGPAGLSGGLSPVGGGAASPLPAAAGWAVAQPPAVAPPANAAPKITNFTAVEQYPGVFVFSGKVVDEAPSGLTVTFGGSVPTAKGRSTTTGADGSFSIIITLKRDGTDAGTVTAQTRDVQGQLSNVASVDVCPTP